MSNKWGVTHSLPNRQSPYDAVASRNTYGTLTLGANANPQSLIANPLQKKSRLRSIPI
ncbi:MAG: hypothetical protein QNJ49_00490 [Mastigocoleus sp. MO_167.B18]|uniref:hypothetical protein n=1 Tax=Mastigocoleus sp. MO_188.B34 TaxID=3036635 RepID=UPI0026078081|nr:hypothetical protein [Mastigocoleus sp. MO_188.B34]MDJ0696877.1 hypothetical protein [Mastigocoleus sp. MO_188.B34]MDJ0771896.1 hypothetical protein [Mastigocoleus sp. MO_167.B18]